MKEEFESYLDEIGVEGELKEKVEKVINYYESLINREIKKIFVTDILEPDGAKRYENLWIIYDNYFAEAKKFNKTDDFDFLKYKGIIKYWNIKKKDFDGNNVNKHSKLNIEFSTENNMGGLFTASKENCKYLMEIFNEYIKDEVI